MRRSMTYGMLVLFVLFMITAQPSETGQNGRNFLGWLAGGWDDTREFVGELLDDSVETNEFGEVEIPTVAPEPQPEFVPQPVPGDVDAPASG